MRENDKSFADIQNEFMLHIRDPDRNTLPVGIEDRRMKIYRELFFNNVEGFVANAFPVLKSLYDIDEWHQLVRDFFSNHDSHSPYFLDISKEFLSYLLEERELQNEQFPFVNELAHYEWVELDISTRNEQALTRVENRDIETASYCLSNLAVSLSYHFPVHQISVDFIPNEPLSEPVYLVIYRDAEDEVKFLQVNAITAILLQYVEQNPSVTFMDCILFMTESLPQFSKEQLEQGLMVVLQDLASKGIIKQRS